MKYRNQSSHRNGYGNSHLDRDNAHKDSRIPERDFSRHDDRNLRYWKFDKEGDERWDRYHYEGHRQDFQKYGPHNGKEQKAYQRSPEKLRDEVRLQLESAEYLDGETEVEANKLNRKSG